MILIKFYTSRMRNPLQRHHRDPHDDRKSASLTFFPVLAKMQAL